MRLAVAGWWWSPINPLTLLFCLVLSLAVWAVYRDTQLRISLAIGVGVWPLVVLLYPWNFVLRIDGGGVAVSWPGRCGRRWFTIGLADVVGFEVRRWSTLNAPRWWAPCGLDGRVAVAVRLRDGSYAHVRALERSSSASARGVHVVAKIGRQVRGRRLSTGLTEEPLRWNAATDDELVAFLNARLAAVRSALGDFPAPVEPLPRGRMELAVDGRGRATGPLKPGSRTLSAPVYPPAPPEPTHGAASSESARR